MITNEEIVKVANIYKEAIEALNQVIIGQDKVKMAVIGALMCDSNSKILLTGNTGLGKTTLVKAIASNFNCEKISVTSDLLPFDIQKQLMNKRAMDMLWIEEFNRASGKVQSTFIELLADRKMNINGEEYSFQDFYVLATQNGADIAGIFNVPQAIYDRFDINVNFDSLTENELFSLLFGGEVSSICTLEKSDLRYANDIVAKLKLDSKDHALFMQAFQIIDGLKIDDRPLFAGSNIRGHKFLIKFAKLVALVKHRNYILPSDIAEFVSFVYMHRINQRVGRISDDNIKDIFQKTEREILELKRARV